jgi:hypothetical protein
MSSAFFTGEPLLGHPALRRHPTRRGSTSAPTS